MDVVTGAMATLLPKLGDLLAEEYQLQASVRDDITFLKSELSSMEAALLRLSEAPLHRPPDAQDRLWAREVRDLTYDIEDCVEAFLLRLGHHAPPKNGDDGLQLQGGLRGFIDRGLGLLKRAKICRDMGADVRSIKRRIVEVGERRVRYKVDGSVADANPDGLTVDSLRLSALYAEKAELVGTGERIDELVRMLLDQEGHETLRRRLKVVSIVGFGGLGKTTLAKIVFDKLKGQFDCAVFVTISLNPNMEKVLRNMLCQLDTSFNANSAMCGEAQAINELREFLRNKRYLIVIDDIWSYSVWNTVKYALIENECGSRIITTTRILDVAKQASASVYLLKPLSLADSRKLFYRRVFGTEDICPPNQLAEVSENILKKCGGVPLAVITIASLLASKKRKENTEKFWYQVYQSMGSGLEESIDVKNMRRILSISYYYLPPHLKTCLLYLTLCSEEYGIMRKEMIYKWVGEGFVQRQHGKTLYEVGEEYYEDLINKSMIQPMLYDHGIKVWSCCVHDMMLDLISSLSEEENFLRALGGSRLISEPNKIRRLSLRNIKDEDSKQVATMNLSHLRSLTVSPETFTLLPALSSFQVIRVLDLCGCTQVDNSHCKHICNLFHLRFLKLSWTSITEMPDEIGNLQLLQFLDIYKTSIKELPSTFIQLRKLEFLYVDNRTRLPEHIGNLKSLQKLLPHIAIRSPSMLRDLSRLTELRHLLVRFDEWDENYEEPFVQCLSSLVNLDSLQIFDCHNGLSSGIGNLTPGPQQLRSINIGPGTIRRVPRWMSSLSALSALDITLLTLEEEDLQILGSVPSLCNLYIWVKDHRKDRDKRLVIGSNYPFRCLTRFRIGRGAMEVGFAPGAMLKLQTFRLDFHVRHTMDQYGDFVFGLENLSMLERVIVHMNCYYAELGEVEHAEASIRKELDLNPKRTSLELEKHGDSWRSG
ncbi:unnamed protein product [Urochloa decumbens]|uniref:Uncharacterized protein n=1 Tax=Urochloa decumbens TaxID=240449 RepID=A0ABC9APM0_9POAL